MTTPEQQRKLYEWLRPECSVKDMNVLQGEPGACVILGYCIDGTFIGWCPPLYNSDGPDMNIWHYKAVPKLEEDGISVMFLSWTGRWLMCPKDRFLAPVCDVDPWAATVEWL